MKVKELVELLLKQPQDADILIDCRQTDDIEIYSHVGWYQDAEDEVVVHITV